MEYEKVEEELTSQKTKPMVMMMVTVMMMMVMTTETTTKIKTNVTMENITMQ